MLLRILGDLNITIYQPQKSAVLKTDRTTGTKHCNENCYREMCRVIITASNQTSPAVTSWTPIKITIVARSDNIAFFFHQPNLPINYPSYLFGLCFHEVTTVIHNRVELCNYIV